MTTYETTGSHILYEGPIFTVRKDNVVMPGGTEVWRDVVDHKDAVAVVALDPKWRIVLVNQYRHPLGKRIWELPAGLIDHDGESAERTAWRELIEEAGVFSAPLTELITVASSPGFTNELVTVFFTNDLEAPANPHLGTDVDDEEADMQVRWVALSEAVRMVEAGEIVSAHSVAGILAAARKVGI